MLQRTHGPYRGVTMSDCLFLYPAADLGQLDEDLHRAAKVKAAKVGTTMADICRKALKAWVKEDPGQQENTPTK